MRTRRKIATETPVVRPTQLQALKKQNGVGANPDDEHFERGGGPSNGLAKTVAQGTGVVPMGEWRGDKKAPLLVQLKDLLLAAIVSPSKAAQAHATKVLDAYAKSLKAGYPGEGEIEGSTEFKDYMQRTMAKDGFEWDILRLSRPGTSAALAGLNINVFDAERAADWSRSASEPGPRYAAIEQGFARKTLSPDQAATFFEAGLAHLKSQNVPFVIMELNDPRIMTEEKMREDDKRTPYRVDHAVYMARYGMRSPPATYAQLDLLRDDDAGSVNHLALGILPTDPSVTSIRADEYLAIVKGYFSTFKVVRDEAKEKGVNPGEIVEADPVYQSIKASVAGREVLPLLDPRTDWKLDARTAARWLPKES